MKGARVLRHSRFRYFLGGRFFLTLAIQIQAICIALEVYRLTGDALALGLSGLAEAIPFMAIVLPAGHWADIFVRKRIILLGGLLFVLSGLILFALALVPDGQLQHQLVWMYGVIALTGLARGILGPAVQATVPNILPREELPEGIAWNTSVWQVAAVAGPAAGGILFGFAGGPFTFALASLLSLSAWFCFFGIPAHPAAHKPKGSSMRGRLAEGLRFVWNQKVILSALSLDMLAVLFGGAVALLPLFNAEILKSGPDGLGILRSAPALGAVLSAVFLARNPPVRHSGKLLLIFVAAFGGCIIGFALSEYFWLSFAMLFLSGAFDGVSVLIRGSIVQLFTPDEMRGRVSAVNSIFIGSSNEIGAFESGLAARLMGLVPSVVFGGSVTIAVTGLMGLMSPKLRKLHLKDHLQN